MKSMGSDGVKRAPKEASWEPLPVTLRRLNQSPRSKLESPYREAADSLLGGLAVRKGATSLVAMTSLRDTVSNGPKPALVAPLHQPLPQIESPK